MTELGGRCALVTGSARGIGLAIARRMAEAGAQVLMCDLLGDELDAAARSMPGGAAATLRADVRDTGQIAAWFDAITTWPDILVNNAAVAVRTPLNELSDEQLNTTLAVNVVAPVRLSQLVATWLIDHHLQGSIINVSSVNAYRGHTDLLHYNASKAALLSVTRTMAAAYGQYGIRVNSICPGSTWTDIWDEGGFSKQDRDEYAARNPMKRFAQPAEIAEVAAFLASGQSSFINGAEIVADGGLTVTA